MMRYIRAPEYLEALDRLARAVADTGAHAVVGIKRSGLFPAVFVSHRLGIPMFPDAEVDVLPEKLAHILLVDAVVDSGRTMERVKRRLLRRGKRVTTAVLFKENATPYAVDHALETHTDLVHFFYERLRWEPREP